MSKHTALIKPRHERFLLKSLSLIPFLLSQYFIFTVLLSPNLTWPTYCCWVLSFLPYPSFLLLWGNLEMRRGRRRRRRRRRRRWRGRRHCHQIRCLSPPLPLSHLHGGDLHLVFFSLPLGCREGEGEDERGRLAVPLPLAASLGWYKRETEPLWQRGELRKVASFAPLRLCVLGIIRCRSNDARFGLLGSQILTLYFTHVDHLVAIPSAKQCLTDGGGNQGEEVISVWLLFFNGDWYMPHQQVGTIPKKLGPLSGANGNVSYLPVSNVHTHREKRWWLVASIPFSVRQVTACIAAREGGRKGGGNATRNELVLCVFVCRQHNEAFFWCLWKNEWLLPCMMVWCYNGTKDPWWWSRKTISKKKAKRQVSHGRGKKHIPNNSQEQPCVDFSQRLERTIY